MVLVQLQQTVQLIFRFIANVLKGQRKREVSIVIIVVYVYFDVLFRALCISIRIYHQTFLSNVLINFCFLKNF